MSLSTAPLEYVGQSSKPYRAYVLGALLAIYALNVIDRILLALVQEQIRVDLRLSDLQLGLLGGPAFAVLYTLLGVPIARYAERANRISIIAIGVAVWSAATVSCGLAQNYVQLLIARAWVGIGEAACIPGSHSVISDYFPSARRSSAMAIYALGIPIGSVIAAFGGGWLVHHMGWRAVFWFLGAPGILAAIILKLTVKEPVRQGEAVQAPKFATALKVLFSKRSYLHTILGGALMGIFGFSLTQFLVSYLVRRYGVEISVAGYSYGIVTGFAVTLGSFLGGFINDRLAKRLPLATTWLSVLGALIAAALYLLVLTRDTFAGAFAVLLIAPIFQYLYFAPLFSLIQSVVEPRMRATSSAIMLLFVTLFGYGVGPPLVGAIADTYKANRLAAAGLTEMCRAQPMSHACVSASAYGLRFALILSVAFLLWAAVHFLLAGRTLIRDRVS